MLEEAKCDFDITRQVGLRVTRTMVWPFGGQGSKKDAQNENKTQGRPLTWSESLKRAEADPLGAAKEWAPVVAFSLVGLGALQLYANYLRRVPGAAFVRPSFFRSRSLYGRVTSVGDGDNFHLFHTPGGKAVGWGWLRKIPETRKDLKDRTISIRIAGIDAPEGAHFGRPAQPFATEALSWLSNYILHRNVRAFVYKRDQYQRIVATVYVRRFFIRRNVGLEMVKKGLATIYEAKSGGEYGGLKSAYEKAEAKAKRKRIGIWSGKASQFESPREYKARYQDQRDSNE